ncbi:hypothetical protein KEC48_06485 [Clostridium sp. C1]|uniref:hypothetical protein n=1 Tax=Clostridium sp. C1 TaxID=1155388 RepID=UPI001BA80D34|nr:hypothetical protein [Clostridium sp. C1]QUN14152.1 hypothetical protein KEC48_06485 [Clostridium sp. C1]
MDNDELRWNNTALELKKDDTTYLNITKLKNECNNFNIDMPMEEEHDKIVIYNNKNLLFKEEEYLKEKTYFKDVLHKLSFKDYSQDLYYVRDDFSIYSIKNNDYQIYSSVIANNNIDGLTKKDLNISIEILEKFERNEMNIKIMNVYIMIFLADKTSFRILSQNQQFEFYIYDDKSNVVVEEKLIYDEIDTDLLSVYKWIVSNREFEASYKVKLDIVRKIIVDKKTFKLTQADLCSCESIFSRVVKNEVKEYFDQVNLLKKDFIDLEKAINDVKRSLHLKILAWLGSIGLVIFDSIKDFKGDNIYYIIFHSHSEKVNIILFMLIISFLVISFAFFIEMKELLKEYKKLEYFYTNKLFFKKEDFENYVSPPSINCLYKIVFFIVIIVCVIRLFSLTI